MSFQCTVVTPESPLFDDTVSDVILPAHDGMYGVQTGHAPTLLRLGAGPLTIRTADRRELKYFIDGGVAQIKDNVLTILTDQAVTPDKLDVESAKKDLAEAGAGLVNAANMKSRERKAARARAVLRMAGVSA